MGKLSTFAKNEVLDHVFKAAYTQPTTVYLCLCTGDPTVAGTGASMSEVADANGYTRKALSFGVAASRKVIQDAQVDFDQASGTWGTITHYSICDSATHGAGNMLAFGSFSSSFAPVSGNTPKVPASEVEVEIVATASGAGFSTWLVHKLLDHMFGNLAYSTPSADIHIACSTTVLDDADAVTGDFTESSGGSYAREPVPASSFGVAGSAAITNTTAITFDEPTGSWGTVVALVTMDHLTAGNILAYDNSNVIDQEPTSGDTVQIAIGAYDAALN